MQDLFLELDRAPSVSAYTRAARQLREHEADLRPIRVALLSSFTIDPLVPFVQVEAARRGFAADTYVAPFGNVAQELLREGSATHEHQPDTVILAQLLDDVGGALAHDFLQLTPEQVGDAIERLVDDLFVPIEAFRSRSSAAIVVLNFALPAFALQGIYEAKTEASQTEAIRRLNQSLVERASEIPGVHVLDFDRLCADIGYRRWRNETGWRLGRAALGADALLQLGKTLGAYLTALLDTPRKCLVVDADNTLWGGVLGEEGAAGIALGADYPGNAFVDFQRSLLDLYHQGVLLALSSKNNEPEVDEVLRTHPEMVLRPEHFAARRIDWRDKPSNLAEIAQELNIGVDSLVFFDDNPAEREMMRRMRPEVWTLEVPADPGEYVATLLEARCFDKLAFTDEDRKRGATYRAQSERRDLERASGSLDDYYQALDMEAIIAPLQAVDFQRAHSLVMKTNQFNLTTRRHAEDVLRAFADGDASEVFTLRLRDRFGDNGLVGLAIVEAQEGRAVIDTFLLSCRVIGRTAETALLTQVVEWARQSGVDELHGVTCQTAKNHAFLSLYQEHGFELLEDGDDTQVWRLPLDHVPFEYPPHIRRLDSSERRPTESSAAS